MTAPYFHGVYAIRNSVTGGMYVGATKDLSRRWPSHSWALRAGRHSDPLLQTAWEQYGGAAFQIVLLESITLEGRHYGFERALRDAERRWMIELMTKGAELYNRTLPQPADSNIVEWNAETMLPKEDSADADV